MATKMVIAIGDDGRQGLFPEAECVAIGAIPLGDRNRVVPETLAWLGHAPARLVGIRRPTADCPYPQIRLRAADGRACSCVLRDALDAGHAVFGALADSSRRRMMNALEGLAR